MLLTSTRADEDSLIVWVICCCCMFFHSFPFQIPLKCSFNTVQGLFKSAAARLQFISIDFYFISLREAERLSSSAEWRATTGILGEGFSEPLG